MTGLERNSGVVRLAAYAPLLANIRHVGALCPTNLVIYDNHRRATLPCKELFCPGLHAARIQGTVDKLRRPNVFVGLGLLSCWSAR